MEIEPKKHTWIWLKDKIAEAIVQISVIAIVALISGSIWLSATGEYRWQKESLAKGFR